MSARSILWATSALSNATRHVACASDTDLIGTAIRTPWRHYVVLLRRCVRDPRPGLDLSPELRACAVDYSLVLWIMVSCLWAGRGRLSHRGRRFQGPVQGPVGLL